ncbi:MULTISPECIES: DUF2790 domain-containing protein [Stutzerimonas]|uniref:DUF2790 domain-containing protein n=1 Tax=Stutzerimonas azotifigens TaxID=291995 RepID=A0ABR5Z120_9GAMM|nr:MULTISPECIES: DUF2790 domain-containing protein [Stutzerimonas]MBA1273898.1 DUF2790 domain-containing protein [Stutzerimonas azotifigens]
MNTGRIMAALSLMTVTSLTMAGGSSDSTYGEMIRANEKAMQEYAISTGKNPPKVVHYRYGMELDIAKVIQTTPTDITCNEVIPAQMTYEDSKGNLNTLEYDVMGTNCPG